MSRPLLKRFAARVAFCAVAFPLLWGHTGEPRFGQSVLFFLAFLEAAFWLLQDRLRRTQEMVMRLAENAAALAEGVERSHRAARARVDELEAHLTTHCNEAARVRAELNAMNKGRARPNPFEARKDKPDGERN